MIFYSRQARDVRCKIVHDIVLILLFSTAFVQVKEKTIAARRNGVKIIIFPSANKKDFEELPQHVREGLDVRFVDHYDQIFDIVFEPGSDWDPRNH